MRSKKSLMGLAALLILIFHFYIPFTGLALETAVYKATYIGVDLFFFLSAYSLAGREKIEYGPFIKNRFLNIYLTFAVLALIGGLVEHWELKKYLEVLSGAQLFMKGGGAFLWFAPAIMLLYFVAPFLVRAKKRFGVRALLGMTVFWLGLVALLQWVLRYTTIMILVNRLPVFFLGLYYEDIRQKTPEKLKLPLIALGLIAGSGIIYHYAATVRLMKPVTDIYYVLCIPFIIALVGISDYISKRTKIRNIPLQFVGGFTLELYGLQMIFGYMLEKKLLKLTGKQELLTFVLTALCLIAAAFLMSLARNGIKKLIKFIKETKK